MRERFLRVHRDASLHRGERSWEVRVVRRADDDEIEFLPVGIHEFAEILVAFRFWKPLKPIGAGHLIDVGNGDDVVLIDIVEAGSRNPAPADETDIQFVAGPFCIGAQKLQRLGSRRRRLPLSLIV